MHFAKLLVPTGVHQGVVSLASLSSGSLSYIAVYLFIIITTRIDFNFYLIFEGFNKHLK